MMQPKRPRRMRADVLSSALLVVALLVAGFVAYQTRPWADGESDAGDLGLVGGAPDAPVPGKPAPDFILMRADGTPLQLSGLRGRPIFLNFWATWCTFCLEEMPDMQRIAEEFGGRVVVVGVNAGESVVTGTRFAERVGVRYELVYDLDQAVIKRYKIRAMPTSYFIDADGTIVDAQFGFMTYDTMREKVNKLLAASD